MIKSLTALLIAAACAAAWPAAAGAGSTGGRAVSLTQQPLVMRLSKDEFRIAFGVNAQGCESHGCSGVIHYKVTWKTEDGTLVFESKRVAYSVLPHYSRTITVDRQYFDTAEGAHTTDVVKVAVDRITCSDGAYSSAAQMASIAGRP
jgi:hypothetical protein